MQLLRPDTLPFIQGFIILILSIIGFAGLVLFLRGIKAYKSKKRNSRTVIKILLGISGIGFVIYNWIGYNNPYSRNEVFIIGDFECSSANAHMKVNSDNTWIIATDSDIPFKRGTWKYVMSEDWCYWNINSDDPDYNAQTGSSEIIFFKTQNLKFTKISSPTYRH